MNSRILVMLFSVFFMSFANAVPVKNLYQAEIKLPVSDSESQMLNDAFAQAVEQVLIRVSGDRNAISGDLLKQAQANASSWVVQHSVVSLNQLLRVDGQLVPGKQVNVVFYSESIDRFLSQHNLPVWDSNRPSVLVWAVSEDNGVRSISGARAPSVLLNDLASSAAMAGLPIYAPLVDQVDKSVLSAADVWGFFESNIRQASKRYQTDAVAAIRVTNYAGSVSGTMLLMLKDGSTQRFNLTGDTLETLAEQANARIAKVFSTRYAAVRNSSAQSRVNVRVNGINGYGALNTVQSYLEKVGVVRDVFILNAEKDSVVFSVTINGSEQKLINSISLSSLLQVDHTPTSEPSQSAVVESIADTNDSASSLDPSVSVAGVGVNDDASEQAQMSQTTGNPVANNQTSKPLEVVEIFKYSGAQ